MKPVYFDLTAQDLASARAFFSNVLGWKFERFRLPTECCRITAVLPQEPGIDGGIGALRDAPVAGSTPMNQVTVAVKGLSATLRKVEASGGKVLKQDARIPGVGVYATCAEPGGLLFSLLQPDAG